MAHVGHKIAFSLVSVIGRVFSTESDLSSICLRSVMSSNTLDCAYNFSWEHHKAIRLFQKGRLRHLLEGYERTRNGNVSPTFLPVTDIPCQDHHSIQGPNQLEPAAFLRKI